MIKNYDEYTRPSKNKKQLCEVAKKIVESSDDLRLGLANVLIYKT